jgi:hypothetical protein
LGKCRTSTTGPLTSGIVETLGGGVAGGAAAFVVGALRLLDDDVVGGGLGLGVIGAGGVEAGVGGGDPVDAVVGVLGEDLACAGLNLLDDLVGGVVPGVAGEGIADGAGVGVDGVDVGLVSPAAGVVAGVGLGDQVAGGGGLALGADLVAEVVEGPDL